MGGIERYIDNLLKFCPKLKHEFVFLLPSSSKNSYEKKGNITIYRKRFFNFVPLVIFGRKTFPREQIQKKADEYFLFLKKLVKEEKFNIVEIQDAHRLPINFNFALHTALYGKKIPMILRLHSYPTTDIHEAVIKEFSWKKIECVSRSVAGDIFSKGTPIDLIDTKYLGIDPQKFSPNKKGSWLRKRLRINREKKIILHASRITDGKKPILKEKGIITLIEAFSKITTKYPDYRLLFATAYPPKIYKREFETSLSKILEYSKLYRIEDKIICKKFQLDDMPSVYANSELFILDSETETLGQVYLEAMASGVPVIGTNVGGVPEIITNNYNGFLIPPNNAALLSQKIDELLSNPEMAASFAKEGLETIRQKFIEEATFKPYFDYLSEAFVEK